MNQHNEKGEKIGLWESYSETGELLYRINYKNGKQHGLYESFWKNGQLFTKGNFKSGRCGLWRYFDNYGELKLTEFFI